MIQSLCIGQVSYAPPIMEIFIHLLIHLMHGESYCLPLPVPGPQGLGQEQKVPAPVEHTLVFLPQWSTRS